MVTCVDDKHVSHICGIKLDAKNGSEQNDSKWRMTDGVMRGIDGGSRSRLRHSKMKEGDEVREEIRGLREVII